MSAFPAWVREQRTALGLTQGEIGHRVGCSDSYISAIERGMVNPTGVTRTKVLVALGVQPDAMPHLFRDLSHSGRPAGPQTKYALVGSPRRLRDLGPLAIPAPGKAVSDVLACPDCGGAMTGRRPVIEGFAIVGNDPVCLRCRGESQFFGFGAPGGKYALNPTPRRLSYLAEKRAIHLAVSGIYVIAPPVPVMQRPVDLWLFEEPTNRGSLFRQRLGALNWQRRIAELEERNVA